MLSNQHCESAKWEEVQEAMLRNQRLIQHIASLREQLTNCTAAPISAPG
eukprot:jgi/Chlat1/2091/Chrsp17S02833